MENDTNVYDETHPAEIILAVQVHTPNDLMEIFDHGILDNRHQHHPAEDKTPADIFNYSEPSVTPIPYTHVSIAYLGKPGVHVNITCISPDSHSWYSTSKNFAEHLASPSSSSSSSSISSNNSANHSSSMDERTLNIIHHKSTAKLKEGLGMKDYLAVADLTMSTLELKNLSVDDVGSYECFSKIIEPTQSLTQILYQDLYLYIDDVDSLIAPGDNFNNIAISWTNESKEVLVISGELGQNILLPCRPTNPSTRVELFKEVQVELFKEVPPLQQTIAEPIEGLSKVKVASSKFYEQRLTELFFYHPRIGFVLDSVTVQDEGRYHCQFLSLHKIDEFKTMDVVLVTNMAEQTTASNESGISTTDASVNQTTNNDSVNTTSASHILTMYSQTYFLCSFITLIPCCAFQKYVIPFAKFLE